MSFPPIKTKGLSLLKKPSRVECHARFLFSSIDSSVPIGNSDPSVTAREPSTVELPGPQRFEVLGPSVFILGWRSRIAGQTLHSGVRQARFVQ